jgi:hypothetical protein
VGGDLVTDVIVPFDDDVSDKAVLLLAAAEELGLGARVVKTNEGAFVVPPEVYDRAFRGPDQVPAKKTRTPAKKK